MAGEAPVRAPAGVRLAAIPLFLGKRRARGQRATLQQQMKFLVGVLIAALRRRGDERECKETALRRKLRIGHKRWTP
jgi:hypothetical protein